LRRVHTLRFICSGYAKGEKAGAVFDFVLYCRFRRVLLSAFVLVAYSAVFVLVSDRVLHGGVGLFLKNGIQKSERVKTIADVIVFSYILTTSS
jgi:hypothetical protein